MSSTTKSDEPAPTPAPTPAPPEKTTVDLPEGCVLPYVVNADKKMLPTDSIVVEVSAPLSLELVPDSPAAAGIASGKLIALDVPANGIKVTATLTHSGGVTLTDVGTVNVVLPDPATSITITLGTPAAKVDPRAPVRGTPRNPHI